MAFEKNIERIKSGDGVIRDIPYEIIRNATIAKLLIQAGRTLTEKTVDDASRFLEAAGAGDEFDPFANVAPGAEGAFGDLVYLASEASKISTPYTHGYYELDRTVRDFVEKLTAFGSQSSDESVS